MLLLRMQIGEEAIISHLEDEAWLRTSRLLQFLSKLRVYKANGPPVVVLREFSTRITKNRIAKARAERPVQIFIFMSLVSVIYYIVWTYNRFKRLINKLSDRWT